jgi:hypothetical protein
VHTKNFKHSECKTRNKLNKLIKLVKLFAKHSKFIHAHQVGKEILNAEARAPLKDLTSKVLLLM